MDNNNNLSRRSWIAILIIAIFSLWIRMNFHVFAVGGAGHDDLLFVQLAANIGKGDWLGNYNNLTHAKGIGYSIFLLLNHASGLPLKLTEHAAYLGTSLFFALTIGRLFQSRIAVLLMFGVLAFLPTAWDAGASGRVMREGIYGTQALLIFTLGICCWLLNAEKSTSLKEKLNENWGKLTVLGLVGGWFWVTREEGVWLFPALLILMLSWIWHQRSDFKHWKSMVAYLVLPFMMATLVVGAVNTVNYFSYGVFKNNDFRSSDFKSGYGALTRIRHDQWQRFVLFPVDARQRAYEMSAAARELRPFFEGSGGERWRQAGCDQTGTAVCPEILSGWFMWALRDAVATAGYYENAKAASAFYERLSAEIDEGCRKKPDYCLPARETMLPPWRNEYFLDTAKASWDVFKTLSSFGNIPPYKLVSHGTAEQLKMFRFVTNESIISPEHEVSNYISPRDLMRDKIALWMFKIISSASSVGLPLALLGWSLWSVICLARRRVPSAAWVVATALSAAVVTRVVLLGLLEVTSMPSNNMLYLAPVAPMSLAMVVFMLLVVLNFISLKIKKASLLKDNRCS